MKKAYWISGHGHVSNESTFVVPEGCIILYKARVNEGITETISRKYYEKFCSAHDKVLKDPLNNLSEIIKRFGPVAIYTPGDTCPDTNLLLTEFLFDSSPHWAGLIRDCGIIDSENKDLIQNLRGFVAEAFSLINNNLQKFDFKEEKDNTGKSIKVKFTSHPTFWLSEFKEKDYLRIRKNFGEFVEIIKKFSEYKKDPFAFFNAIYILLRYTGDENVLFENTPATTMEEYFNLVADCWKYSSFPTKRQVLHDLQNDVIIPPDFGSKTHVEKCSYLTKALMAPRSTMSYVSSVMPGVYYMFNCRIELRLDFTNPKGQFKVGAELLNNSQWKRTYELQNDFFQRGYNTFSPGEKEEMDIAMQKFQEYIKKITNGYDLTDKETNNLKELHSRIQKYERNHPAKETNLWGLSSEIDEAVAKFQEYIEKFTRGEVLTDIEAEEMKGLQKKIEQYEKDYPSKWLQLWGLNSENGPNPYASKFSRNVLSEMVLKRKPYIRIAYEQAQSKSGWSDRTPVTEDKPLRPPNGELPLITYFRKQTDPQYSHLLTENIETYFAAIGHRSSPQASLNTRRRKENRSRRQTRKNV